MQRSDSRATRLREGAALGVGRALDLPSPSPRLVSWELPGLLTMTWSIQGLRSPGPADLFFRVI